MSTTAKAEVTGFMKTYLEDAEALDGLEFLSMAEAGELAHWEILAKLSETANDPEIARIVKFRFSRRTSTQSESTRFGSPAKKTPPSRHEPDRQPIDVSRRPQTKRSPFSATWVSLSCDHHATEIASEGAR